MAEVEDAIGAEERKGGKGCPDAENVKMAKVGGGVPICVQGLVVTKQWCRG